MPSTRTQHTWAARYPECVSPDQLSDQQATPARHCARCRWIPYWEYLGNNQTMSTSVGFRYANPSSAQTCCSSGVVLRSKHRGWCAGKNRINYRIQQKLVLEMPCSTEPGKREKRRRAIGTSGWPVRSLSRARRELPRWLPYHDSLWLVYSDQTKPTILIVVVLTIIFAVLEWAGVVVSRVVKDNTY